MRGVLGLLVVVGMIGPAHAFEFSPESFDRVFAAKAAEMGVDVRISSGGCKSEAVTKCLYTVNALDVTVLDAPESTQAAHVAVQGTFSSDSDTIADVAPVLAALCSTEVDQRKRSEILFALQTAYDNDEVANPNVRVVLDGRRYLRRRMSDGSALFQIDDVATWKDDPRPVQTAALPSSAPAPPDGGDRLAAEPTSAEPPTATTKDIVASFSPSDFKVADPADLFVAPHKFLGKPIEVRHFHCYYADVGDYRCVAPGYDLVALFMPDVGPPAEKDRLENECGAMKALMTAKCDRTLHVVVDDVDHDHVDTRDRVLLRAATATLMPPAPPPAPRKRR